MIGRRSLLRLLSAAPLAASAPTRAIDMLGLAQTVGLGSLVNTVGGGSVGEGSQTSETGQPTYVKAATYLLANGIPAFAKDAIRREQRTPRGLDPDLAVNRSFSLAAKLQLQRDRDLERTIENTMAQQKTALSRYALNSTLGFDLWW